MIILRNILSNKKISHHLGLAWFPFPKPWDSYIKVMKQRKFL